MRVDVALLQDSSKTPSLRSSTADRIPLFSQNRLAPFSIVLGVHLILLGWFLTLTPLRQTVVRYMPVSVLGISMSKITQTAVPIPAAIPASVPASGNQVHASSPVEARVTHVPVTQTSIARFEPDPINPPVVTAERDFPANPLPILNVPNPVTEQREEIAKPATATVLEAEKNEPLKIGEMDNNVIVITKLGSSKAEYLAPNFLHAQLEQSHFQVEVGDFEDIETALVNQIITQIRTRYKKEIFWNSKIKARMVRLSMLPQDHAELEKFLKMEIFGKKKVRDYSYWDKSKF